MLCEDLHMSIAAWNAWEEAALVLDVNADLRLLRGEGVGREIYTFRAITPSSDRTASENRLRCGLGGTDQVTCRLLCCWKPILLDGGKLPNHGACY